MSQAAQAGPMRGTTGPARDVSASGARPPGHPGWWAGALLLGAALLGCNWLTGPRRPERPKQGLIVRVVPHLAVLEVNEKPLARLSAREPNVIGLPPGTYRIAVRKAGYFTRYYDVTVRAGTFVRLTVRLPREVD